MDIYLPLGRRKILLNHLICTESVITSETNGEPALDFASHQLLPASTQSDSPKAGRSRLVTDTTTQIRQVLKMILFFRSRLTAFCFNLQQDHNEKSPCKQRLVKQLSSLIFDSGKLEVVFLLAIRRRNLILLQQTVTRVKQN